MNVGVLTVDIAMNIARLQQDVGQAKGIIQDATRDIERSIGVVKSALGALGITLSAGFFAKWIEGSYSAQASMLRFAQTAGTTVEVFSSLRPAMKNSQTDAEAVAAGMQKLAKNMAESGDGTTKAAKVFDALKISLTDAGGGMRQTQDVMRELGSKLMSMKDQTLAVAFAQETFGKAGANLLPFLYELARVGTQQAKVTREQAEAAKHFEDNLNALRGASEQARNAFANDLLPTLTKITDQMVAARLAAGDLTGALRLFFSATRGQVADPMSALTATEGQIAKLREQYPGLSDKDIGDAPYFSFGRTDKVERNAAAKKLQQLETDRKYFQGLAQKQADSLGRDPNSPYFDFAGGGIPTEPKNPLGQNEALLKRYASTLQSLNKQYFDLTHAGTASFVMYETEHGTLLKLDTARKAELMTIAQQIDAYRRLTEIREANHAARQAELALTTANQEAIARETYEYAQERDDLEFQVAIMGKSSVEQEKLNAQRRIELDLRRNIRALTPIDEGNVAGLAERQSAVDRLRQDAEDQKRAVIDAIDARQKAERSWLTGARNGMHDYVELAQNTAAMSQRLFVDAFQGMEDALVRFVKTGKLNFRDMVDSIETDLIRLVVRQQITGPLAQMLGGAFGAIGGAVSSGLGALGFSSAAGLLSRGAVNPEAAGGFGGIYGGAAGAGATAAGAKGFAGMSGSAAGATAGFAALAIGDFMSAQNGRDWTRTLYGGMPPMAGRISEKLGVPEFFIDPIGATFGHEAGLAQRTGNFSAGFGQAGSSTSNQWFSGSEMGGALGSFAQTLAAQEQNIITNMHLTGERVAQVNAALSGLSGRTYGYGQEHSPVEQSGAFSQIQADRLAEISRVLGTSIEDLTSVMSLSADEMQRSLGALHTQSLTLKTQLRDLLGVDSLQQFRDNLKVSDLSTGGPMDQLGAARDTFQRDLAAVKSGDYSRIGAFEQEGSQYLQLARGVYASGQGYSDIYAEVNSALDAVQAKTNEYLKDLPSTILQTSADQVAAIKAQTDELVTTLKDVGSKIDRLRAAGVE